MARALTLARRGEGAVEPNPMVGCVLVGADGQVLGTGWHRRYGGRHAEVEALLAAQAAGHDPRGATAYVTLEPCCHHGKQPPCTQALIAAGVRRVVAALRDPYPAVAGKGFAALRRAGIRVEVGCAADAARELLAPWLRRVEQGRPWVIAKWAQSVDGRLSTPAGDSQWITGLAARTEAHALRGRCDAVIVGGETLRRDDPLLLPTLVRPKRTPVRVVVSASLDLPLRARLFRAVDDGPVEVWTTRRAARARAAVAAALARRGVTVRAAGRGRVLSGGDLRGLLRRAAVEQRWTNVMVEGGGRLHGALLDAGLVDEVVVYIGGVLIGGHGTTVGRGLALAGDGRARLGECARLVGVSVTAVGTDWCLRGRVVQGA